MRRVLCAQLKPPHSFRKGVPISRRCHAVLRLAKDGCTAHHTESEEIHFVAQADPEADYSCIDCEEPVEYVRGHNRKHPSGTVSTVSAHFRYSNCSHGTVDHTKRQGPSGGGGSGGGGESQLHKQRKRAALQEALQRFSSSDYDTEYTIGSKRADEVIIFEDPHEEYGKGLVIEYQHKNEGKDIPETEKHFARHEYTTVWLWEEQYNFSSQIPEIDLFGGRVYTPWPDAVPPQDDWNGLGHDTLKRESWANAHENGLTTFEVPATVIRDWVVPSQQEYWDRRPWPDRFDEPDQFLIGWDYAKVEATIPAEWIIPAQHEYWEQQPWDDRFRNESEASGEDYIEEVIDHFGLPSTSIPVKLPAECVKQLLIESRQSKKRANIDRPSNPYDDVQCWNCETSWWVDNDNHYTECPTCGTPVDFAWNLETQRISEIPEYANQSVSKSK